MSERWLKQADIPGMEPLITQYCRDVNARLEDGILLTVEKAVGFHVDKDRLMQALTDAGAFYEEGYRAAMRGSEWISVEERLPEPYRTVLVARKFEGVSIELQHSEGEWAADNSYSRKYHPVTHWMPLPEPPVDIAELATTTATVAKKERVRCADCKHLVFSDCYGECGAGHRGIVRPDETCPHGERRGDDG